MKTNAIYTANRLSTTLGAIADQLLGRAMTDDLLTASEIKSLQETIRSLADQVSLDEVKSGRSLMVAVAS